MNAAIRSPVRSDKVSGKDLDFAWEQGTLKLCVRQLVRSCLEDQEGNKKAIANGQAALEMLQEERSEQSESEAGKEKRKGNKKRVYPSLGELRKELKEPGEDSESEEDIYEAEDLTEDEEGDIIELMEKHSLKVPENQHPKIAALKQGHRPTAPPPYYIQEEVRVPGCSAFCPEEWRTVRTEFQIARPLAYPVFMDGNQQRYHEPLDFKIVKALAELVRTYEVTAAFTVAQVEALNLFCMTPGDWMNLVPDSGTCSEGLHKMERYPYGSMAWTGPSVSMGQSCDLDLPCVNLDPDTAPYSATNVSLQGALCFSIINSSNPCIWMKNGSVGNWLDPLTHNQISNAMLTEVLTRVSTGARSGSGTGTNGTRDVNITTLLMLMEVLRPSNSCYDQFNSTARQVLPYCVPNPGYPPHWTPCQSPDHKLKQIAPGFEFTPPLDRKSLTSLDNFWPSIMEQNEGGLTGDQSLMTVNALVS
ncbi:olfactory receptor [Cricetulus griseus]|nr:olfactory receptor [Cricetulus griseus]